MKAHSERLARRVVRTLSRLYPDAGCALRFRSPFELLVATILSAQCTDDCVNRVTPGLFARFPDAESLARAELGEVEALIHPTGFFRTKSRNLVTMARCLVEEHGGNVPQDLDCLMRLPGVGRKTANVVLGTAFGIASGVVVDTHVKRLAYRIGLTEATDPEAVERDLMAAVPRREWIALSHRLIQHGRAVCRARGPRCTSCGLQALCGRRGLSGPSAGA